MADAQQVLSQQQAALAAEQEAFAVERARMVDGFRANVQQRVSELEVTSLPIPTS